MSLFARFKVHCDKLGHCKVEYSPLDLTTFDEEQQVFLKRCIKDVDESLNETKSIYQPRDDYLEMLELCQDF